MAAASRGVSVTAQVSPAAAIGAAAFAVCPAAHGAACALGNLAAGQVDVIQVHVPVGQQATAGEQVRLTATAAAPGARSFSAAATDVVATSPTSTPTAATSSPAILVPIPLPTISVSPLPGTGVSAQNPASLFPTVGPSPTLTFTPLSLPIVQATKPTHAGEAAATVPVARRLTGALLAGLAVLAGVVAVAIARMSVRPKPKNGDAPTDGRPE